MRGNFGLWGIKIHKPKSLTYNYLRPRTDPPPDLPEERTGAGLEYVELLLLLTFVPELLFVERLVRTLGEVLVLVLLLTRVLGLGLCCVLLRFVRTLGDWVRTREFSR